LETSETPRLTEASWMARIGPQAGPRGVDHPPVASYALPEWDRWDPQRTTLGLRWTGGRSSSSPPRETREVSSSRHVASAQGLRVDANAPRRGFDPVHGVDAAPDIACFPDPGCIKALHRVPDPRPIA
jgi:hypothetical protein